MKTEPFRNLPDLERDLLELVAQIPAGRVCTYGSLAKALGNPVAARWVGHFLLHHNHAAGCPCHRVVRADGSIGQYVAGGPQEKTRLLAADGVEVGGGAVDLARLEFDRFQSDHPLTQLTATQAAIAEGISLRGRRALPSLVAGVDVSYAKSGDGVAAYVLVKMETAERLWTTTIRRPVRFPYITSYLSFREIPLLLDLMELVESAGRKADLLLVDGSGALHPRGAGIASHFGVAASIATVGVTKKLLCGHVDREDMEPLESRPVVLGGKATGVAIRPTAGSRRPIFVSPGNRVGLATAETVVRRLLVGHRLPEPLYWADRISRSDAKGET